MSLPVDYWDYLGWKDTLANPGHTNRQRAYSRTRGDREVYTPQVVVNGMAHALGSDRSAIESAIKHTAKHAGTLSLPIAVSVANNQISVNVPADKGNVTKGEIWLCPITKNVPVAVRKGENSATRLRITTWCGNGSSSASGPARRAASRCRCANSAMTKPSRSR